MKLLRHILIGLGAAGFILAALTVSFFNRSAFGWQLLSVPTASMRPAMSPGSLAIVHRVPIASLKVGDVITHTNPLNTRTTLTHRIIKVYKADGEIPAFVTKGDANPVSDPPVVGGLVQGRMVGHVPYAGETLLWAKTWTGIAVLVYLPALLIMIHETRLLATSLHKLKPYRLEGWTHVQSDQSEPDNRLRWAFAASAAVVVVMGGVTGWQTAGALAGQPQSQTLLVLTSNVITTTAPASPAPASSPGGSAANSAGTNTNTTAANTSCVTSTNKHQPKRWSTTMRHGTDAAPGTNNAADINATTTTNAAATATCR